MWQAYIVFDDKGNYLGTFNSRDVARKSIEMTFAKMGKLRGWRWSPTKKEEYVETPNMKTYLIKEVVIHYQAEHL